MKPLETFTGRGWALMARVIHYQEFSRDTARKPGIREMFDRMFPNYIRRLERLEARARREYPCTP